MNTSPQTTIGPSLPRVGVTNIQKVIAIAPKCKKAYRPSIFRENERVFDCFTAQITLENGREITLDIATNNRWAGNRRRRFEWLIKNNRFGYNIKNGQYYIYCDQEELERAQQKDLQKQQQEVA